LDDSFLGSEHKTLINQKKKQKQKQKQKNPKQNNKKPYRLKKLLPAEK